MARSKPWPAQAAGLRRTARVVAVIQVGFLIVCGPVLFYLIAFTGPRPDVVLALVLTGGYVLIMAASAWLLYHVRKRRALKLTDAGRPGI